MKISKTIFIALLIIVIPFVAFGIWHIYELKFAGLPVIGPEEQDASGHQVAHEVPDFHFLNQDSGLFHYADWNSKLKVVDFIYTSCRSTCPKMTSKLKTVQQIFAADTSLGIISFTVDPETDTPERLQEYAQIMDLKQPQWQLLTGPKKAIYALARKAFLLTVSDGDGGKADFIHSDEVVLVDTKNHIRGFYDGTDDKEVGILINDIKKLQK